MKKNNIFTHKFLPILGLVFFILFILLINNSFASIMGTFTTTDGYIYSSFPDIPSEISNYKYYLICNYYNTSANTTLNNRIVLLYSNEPFYYLDEGTGRYLLYSVNMCDLGYHYFINSNSNESWSIQKNSGGGVWTNQINNAHYYLLDYRNPTIYISNADVYNKADGSIYFSSTKALFYLSNTEPTYDYPQILSQLFDYENINNYEAYISLDDEKWESFNVEYFNINDDGSPQENSPFTYYYNVFENGNYHIRLFDNSTGQYIYDDYINVTNLAFDIYYSTEETDEPLYVYSNDFPFDSYFVYISKDRQNWEPMNLEYVDYVPGQDNILNAKERRWYYITSNGIYYFKFVECSAEEGVGDTYYVKKEINNLLVDNYMSDYYVPTPIISLDFNEEEQCFIVKTQNILLDKALNMKCFYTTDFESTNITNWTQMEIDFYNNTFLENSQEAYFYFTIPVVGASDTDYRIAFYNYFSNTAGEIVIYEFRYDKAIDYVENELKINLSFPIKFNILINYFKDRFGFLTYPIEFIINLLNKILNIEYGEPIINIPELYIPGTNTKVFSGYSYNFNILLENQAILNIYNIYLVAVDFIIIISLIVLAYKIIMEVFNK